MSAHHELQWWELPCPPVLFSLSFSSSLLLHGVKAQTFSGGAPQGLLANPVLVVAELVGASVTASDVLAEKRLDKQIRT